MAVFCGACGNRIGSAPDNYGSFKTTGEDFGGWDVDERRVGFHRINDTCERCSQILSAAVTKAAKTIASKHTKAIAALKVEMAGWKDRQVRIEKVKDEFERDWLEQRRKLGL